MSNLKADLVDVLFPFTGLGDSADSKAAEAVLKFCRDTDRRMLTTAEILALYQTGYRDGVKWVSLAVQEKLHPDAPSSLPNGIDALIEEARASL